MRAGAVLLAHRHPERQWYANCWDLVGGHIEGDEAAGDALRRECREEIGIEVVDLDPVLLPNNDPAIELHAFLVRSWIGEPENRAPAEHDDLGWFRPEEIDPVTMANGAILPVLAILAQSP